MRRAVPIIATGLLAALCFACVAVAPPPPPLTASVVSKACNAASFATGVQVLDAGYDPNGPGHDNAQPPPQGSTQNSTYKTALENAFNLAPPKVQAELCNLDGVYINGGGCQASDPSCSGNSWGYRARSNKGLYIAIAAGLWNRTQPYTYHQYETDLLDEIFHWNLSWLTPAPPQYLPANSEADNFDMTVLAALAHELGHVLWYEVIKRNSGEDYDPNTFCASNGSTFFSGSWMTPVHKPPHWRGLGDRVGDSHKANPQISEIDNYMAAAQTDFAVLDLNTLYQASYPWASYFSALSPDEDFVETFKFYVLTNANKNQVPNEGPLTSFPLRVYFVNGGHPNDANIPADYSPGGIGKTELARKVACIYNNLP